MLIFRQIQRLVPFQLLYAAMNLTSNEMFNYKRYNYLKNARGKYHNPFSRGVCHNMAEYFACISPAEPEHASIRDLWTPTIWEIKHSGLVTMNKMWSVLNWFKLYFREYIISVFTNLDLFLWILIELRTGEGMTATMQSDLLKTWLAWQSKITFKGIVNIYFVFLELAADNNIYQWFTLLQNYHGPGIVLRYEVWWFIPLVISI